MDWATIRSAFIRLRGARTQQEIADAGQLRQSHISKLESNDNLGPAVGTFVKAVQGLGVSVSDFFRQLEAGDLSIMASSKTPPVEAADERTLPPYPSEPELLKNWRLAVGDQFAQFGARIRELEERLRLAETPEGATDHRQPPPEIGSGASQHGVRRRRSHGRHAAKSSRRRSKSAR